MSTKNVALELQINANPKQAIQALEQTVRATRLLSQEENYRARQLERDAKVLAKGTEEEKKRAEALKLEAQALRQSAQANALKASQQSVVAQNAKDNLQATNLSTTSLIAYSVAIGAVTAALTFAVKSYTEYESNLVRMTTLLGDAGIAQSRLNEIITMAANTPFSTAELVESNNIMLAYGLTLTETKKQLSTLGDIASGTGGDLRGLALVVGQINSAGRLMGQDALQLTTRGIPIYKELAKIMGQNSTAIKKMGEDGKISAELVNQALDNMVQKGGVFYNAMNMQSITLAGKWSTLWDNVTMLAVNSFGRIAEGLSSLMSDFNKLFENTTVKTIQRDIYENEKKLTDLLEQREDKKRGIWSAGDERRFQRKKDQYEFELNKLRELEVITDAKEKKILKEQEGIAALYISIKKRIDLEKEGSLEQQNAKTELLLLEGNILRTRGLIYKNTILQMISEKETTATKEEQVKLEKQKTAELEKQDKLKKSNKAEEELVKEFGTDEEKNDLDYQLKLAKLNEQRQQELISLDLFEQAKIKLLEEYRRKQDEIQLKTVDRAAPISQKNPYAEELAIQEQQRLADTIAEQKAISTQAELDAEKQKYGVLYGFHEQYIKAKKFLDQTGLSASLAMGEQLMNTADGQSRALFEVGKVLAISNAIYNGIGAVQTTLAQYPFPFSLIPAGIVGGMAALNVAKIASTEYGSTSVDRSIARSGSLNPQTIDLQKDKKQDNQETNINDILRKRSIEAAKKSDKDINSDMLAILTRIERKISIGIA